MFLLKRNWFMSDQDVYDLFWELPEEVYFHVYDRRDELPENLHHLFPVAYPNFSKLKLHDITDKEWNDEILRKEEERIQAIRRFKKKYVAPPRPREESDLALEESESQLEKNNIMLEDMIRVTKKSKKYVPPGQRESVEDDPMIRQQREKIRNLENGITSLKERVGTLNKTWNELKYLDALLENVGNLYVI